MFDDDDDKEPILIVLGVLAAVIAIVSWWFLDGRDESRPAAVPPAPTEPVSTTTEPGAPTPSVVTIDLGGAEGIELRGAVPEQAIADTLVAKAVEVFGQGSVVDDLTTDDTTTADGGTVTIIGTVGGEGSRQRVLDAFGPLVAAAGYDIDDQIRVNEVSPSEIVMAIDGDAVVLTGGVPDAGTRDEMVALATTIFGAGNVDDQLAIDPNTTTEGGIATIEGEISGRADAERVRNGLAAGLTGGSYSIDDQSTVGQSQAVEQLNQLVNGDPIEFDSGSAAIRPSEETTLNEALAILLANPDVLVEIQGHTDSAGPPDANLALSQARAESVRAYLVANNVPDDQVTAVGYGEADRLVAPDDTPEAQQANRRIVFVDQNSRDR